MVSTLAPEFRRGASREGRSPSGLVNEQGGIIAHISRRRLMPWRRLGKFQRVHLSEYLNSEFWLDKTSAYSMKPVELLPFDTFHSYYKCFAIGSTCKYTVNADLASCKWIDLAGRRVKVRQASLGHAIEHLTKRSSQGDHRASQLLREVFQPIQQDIQEGHLDSPLLKRFVDTSYQANKNTIVSFTDVRPSETLEWCVHLILTLGQFETEAEIFSCGSMYEAFQKARLLPPDDPIERAEFIEDSVQEYVRQRMEWFPEITDLDAALTEARLDADQPVKIAHRLTLKYLYEEGQYKAIGVKQLKRRMKDAEQILNDFVTHKEISYLGKSENLPSFITSITN